jgi:hypothetical protein
MRNRSPSGNGSSMSRALMRIFAPEGDAVKKTEIQERVSAAHAKLLQALSGLTEEEATQKGLNPQWSVRDALAHITAWEIEGARRVRAIQAGTYQPDKLNRAAIDDFNARAVEDRQHLSLREATDEFTTAHQEMENLIESLPEEVDESSLAYKFIEGVTFKHLAHHAEQIENYRHK